jgi:hypothetical protein
MVEGAMRREWMNRTFRIGICALIYFLAGCEKVYEEFHLEGKEDFFALCKKDAGMTINEVVEVDGYFDDYESGYVWENLIKLDLTYIEVGLDQHEIDAQDVMVLSRTNFPEFSGKKIKVFTEPGYWRVSRTAIDSDDCHPVLKEHLQRYSYGEAMENYKQSGCFKVEKVDSLKSRYGRYSNSEVVKYNPSSKMKIMRFEESVKNMIDDKYLVKSLEYSWWPGPDSGLVGSAFPGRSRNCSDVNLFKGRRQNVVAVAIIGNKK